MYSDTIASDYATGVDSEGTVAIPPPVGVVIVMLPESGSGPVASDMEMEIMLESVLAWIDGLLLSAALVNVLV